MVLLVGIGSTVRNKGVRELDAETPQNQQRNFNSILSMTEFSLCVLFLVNYWQKTGDTEVEMTVTPETSQ